MSSRRIGILGGTFDPIHRGHADMGRAAQDALGLRAVFVIPSNAPPHRAQTHASAFHRFAMVAQVVSEHDTWRAADLELRQGGTSYTADTLRRFHERGYPPSDLFFIIGVDAFVEIATWRDYPRILDWTHFAVVSRPGHLVGALPYTLPDLSSRMVSPPFEALAAMDPSIILIDAPTANVSSTAIRQRCAEGQTIAGLVSPGVRKHVEQHGLYTSPRRRRVDLPFPATADRLHGQD
jgi:nicotinate-nucleotide adenylyltransferase